MLSVLTQLFRSKLPPPWMLVVVTVDFSMTFKADWNSVADVIVAGGVGLRNNVIQLDLHSAIPMTNTATAVTPNE